MLNLAQNWSNYFKMFSIIFFVITTIVKKQNSILWKSNMSTTLPVFCNFSVIFSFAYIKKLLGKKSKNVSNEVPTRWNLLPKRIKCYV